MDARWGPHEYLQLNNKPYNNQKTDVMANSDRATLYGAMTGKTPLIKLQQIDFTITITQKHIFTALPIWLLY
jgi:hypothetical protein